MKDKAMVNIEELKQVNGGLLDPTHNMDEYQHIEPIGPVDPLEMDKQDTDKHINRKTILD